MIDPITFNDFIDMWKSDSKYKDLMTKVKVIHASYDDHEQSTLV